jgi:mersacidin/lichenicidin family type 2 lantibiotic
MKEIDVIRAWKDEEYRMSLNDAQRARLPSNPAGIIELSDADLAFAAGGTDTGTKTWQLLTYGCCETVTPCGGGGTRSIATVGCCPSFEEQLEMLVQ